MTGRLVFLRKRADAIIAVTEDYREEFNDDAIDADVLECVEDCTGWTLSESEKKLAIAAYNTDGKTAKKGIWYP